MINTKKFLIQSALIFKFMCAVAAGILFTRTAVAGTPCHVQAVLQDQYLAYELVQAKNRLASTMHEFLIEAQVHRELLLCYLQKIPKDPGALKRLVSIELSIIETQNKLALLS